MPERSVVWFRRDLRVGDQPTFLAAADSSDEALAVFVLDPALIRPSGGARLTFLYGCLRELDAALGGRLLVVEGDPTHVLPRVAQAPRARALHLAAGYRPLRHPPGQGREKAPADAR